MVRYLFYTIGDLTYQSPLVEVQLFFSLTSALDGGRLLTPCPNRLTPGNDPVSIVNESGWAPGPV